MARRLASWLARLGLGVAWLGLAHRLVGLARGLVGLASWLVGLGLASGGLVGLAQLALASGKLVGMVRRLEHSGGLCRSGSLCAAQAGHLRGPASGYGGEAKPVHVYVHDHQLITPRGPGG